ncbi:MAG: O-antigen ligase family protein [Bdellovibrionales bacterium]|nr:O-antigen ligase family protein [Bdellovibrionales bacterium]
MAEGVQTLRTKPSQTDRIGIGLLSAFVFFTLSALHLESSILVRFNFEMILFFCAAALYVPAFVLSDSPQMTGWMALVACLAMSPLLTSMVNQQDLRVLFDSEYRSWVKALLLLPLLPWICRKKPGRDVVVDALLAGLCIFCLIVQYRFHFLGEMRLLDDRPKVHVKNGDPNFICVLAAVAIPFALHKWRQAEKTKWVYFLVLLLLSYTVLVTESRMGLLSVGVGLAVAAVFARKGLRLAAVGVLGLLILGTVFLGDAVGRFRSLSDASNHQRWRSIQTGWQLAQEKPFFGFGWGESAKHFYRVTGHDRLMSEASPLAVHNTALQMWGELGFFGLVLFGALFFGALGAAFPAAKRGDPLGIAALSALTILSLNLLTLPLKSKDFVIVYLAIIVAVSLPLGGAIPNEGTKRC